jgi:serine/threonine-protein kinase OSR1/STK39
VKKQPGASGKLHRTSSGEWVWSSDEDEQDGSENPRTIRRHSSATISSSDLPGPGDKDKTLTELSTAAKAALQQQQQEQEAKTSDTTTKSSSSNNSEKSVDPVVSSTSSSSNATVNLVLRMRYVCIKKPNSNSNNLID